jgi:ABC-type sugar transport system ATPase subunit
MVQVVIRKVGKIFEGRQRHRALSDISLTAADGEFLVVLGPSGSGKTTLLRAIAGLETVDSGDIEIGDRRVNDLDPGARKIGMVFQDYALYPHFSVRDNIGYNMRLRHLGRVEIDRRINEVAAMLGIERLLDRRPAELSGGERQRVAVARAITRDASVLLMDEPLSNLDAQIREHVRVELRELQRRIGVTTIYVTHDQVEAMVVADRIAVMSEGKVEQVGTPNEVYGRPATLFCARFVGSPKVNELRGRLKLVGDQGAEVHLTARSGDTTLRVDLEAPYVSGSIPEEVIVAFRPEDTRIAADGNGCIRANIALIENRGAEKYVVAELPAEMQAAQVSPDLRLKLDQSELELGQAVFFFPDCVHFFEESSGRHIATGRRRNMISYQTSKPSRVAG